MEEQPLMGFVQFCDILDTICRFLDFKTLKLVAEVHELLRKAVIREIRKRKRLVQLHEPFVFKNSKESPIPTLVDMICNMNPTLSILVYNDALNKSGLWVKNPIHNLRNRLLRDLRKHLECKAIALHVYGFLHTDDIPDEKDEPNVEQQQKKFIPIHNNGLLGFFFPNNEQQARVEVAWAKRHYGRPDEAADLLLHELGLNVPNRSKSTVLLFVYSYQGFRIVDEFKQRLDPKSEVTWTSIFDQLPITTTDDSGESDTDTQNIVALKISGPGVQSWNLRFHARLPTNEIISKLKELNEKAYERRADGMMLLRGHCTGLVYAVDNEQCNGGDLMRTVKSVFKDIRFVGIFVDRNWPLRKPINYDLDDYENYFMYAVEVIIIAYV